jgi:hypothetical protein
VAPGSSAREARTPTNPNPHRARSNEPKSAPGSSWDELGVALVSLAGPQRAARKRVLRGVPDWRNLTRQACPGLIRALVWEIRKVAQIDPLADALVGDWLTLPDVADRLGIPMGRVRQLLRDRKLLAVRRPDGTLSVPGAFLADGQVLKGLHGTLTLLFDCGFDDPEALRWLFTADETLPGTPIEAMTQHRRTEVNRRAQALAF